VGRCMADVGVVLPVRDPHPVWFRRALTSTLRSVGVAVDVVVVDHGSAVAVSVDDARARVVRVDAAVSFADALNAGRAAVSAGFIARMDGDDIMHPRRLVEDLAAFAVGPAHLAVVASRTKIIPKSTTRMRSYSHWQNSVLSEQDHREQAFIELPVCHPSITMRASALDAIGGYIDQPWPEDYDLFLRFLSAGYGVIKRPVVRHGWRQHDHQVTRTFSAKQSRDALAACKVHHMVLRYGLRDRRVIVVGAGREGRRVARTLASSSVAVAGFLDVDAKKIGRVTHGAPVTSSTSYQRAAGDFLIGAVGTSGARGAVRAFFADHGFVVDVDACLVV
jgi:hypothetical protein